MSDSVNKMLLKRIEALEAQVRRLQSISVRAEIAGAFSRLALADLPTEYIAGRVYFVTDVQGGVLYIDNGASINPIGGGGVLLANGDTGAGVAAMNTFTGVTDTPTFNPGWSTSDTVPMTAPSGYIKGYVGTQAVTIPFWNT